MLRREGKSLPLLFSDDEAEAFIGSADLSDYDLTALKLMQPELASNDACVSGHDQRGEGERPQ